MANTLPAWPPRPLPVGISAIAAFQPDWILPNDWFESNMARKFVRHTGILARPIAVEDEVALGRHAVENLVRETRCDLSDCVALVFVSPSFVPVPVARKHLSPTSVKQEQLSRAARRLASGLGIRSRHIFGVNSFCSGYARAMTMVLDKIVPATRPANEKFILVVTSSRISRITDFACKQSGALFGDLATATLVSRCDSKRYPVSLELLDASFRKKPANRPFFDFAVRQNVLFPTLGGGRAYDPKRIVFSMDGMGIADTAPRAMASAAVEACQATGLRPRDVQCIVPHQAGEGIVRLTGMKLEEAGFNASLINGMTRYTGNVSSGSVPAALRNLWGQLQGNILCPVAAVGGPGKSEVSQGCLVLRGVARNRAAA
jgi:3-oxoacyl-[acyl-carrier-protein] synthase III